LRSASASNDRSYCSYIVLVRHGWHQAHQVLDTGWRHVALQAWSATKRSQANNHVGAGLWARPNNVLSRYEWRDLGLEAE
jgi:hypothetical protein